jgi:hypothetical protein
MAKTRPREAAEERADAPAAKVTLTNLYRTQPLSFHFSGGSARLGPLEQREVDRSCLSSPELAHLIATGAVKLSEGSAPAGSGPAEASADAAGARGRRDADGESATYSTKPTEE